MVSRSSKRHPLLDPNNGITFRFLPGLLIGALLHKWLSRGHLPSSTSVVSETSESAETSTTASNVRFGSSLPAFTVGFRRVVVQGHCPCPWAAVSHCARDDSRLEIDRASSSSRLSVTAHQGHVNVKLQEFESHRPVRASSRGSSSRSPVSAASTPVPKEEYKLVLCVNQELKMTKGKVAAQCCHAAVAVVCSPHRDSLQMPSLKFP